MSKLFSPLRLGTMPLRHRIAMASLTRLRTDQGNIPLPIVRDYYEQRASVPGTLLISEGLNIDPSFQAPFNLPSLVNATQVASWKSITDAVHAKGSFIVAQLCLSGRAGSTVVDGKRKVLAPSAIPIEPTSEVPTPMSERDIQNAIEMFVTAAHRALEAGFDAVEIHGANGYLVDQFTQDTANLRDDRWGGNIENRSRFRVEVTKAVVEAIGAEKVGYRISPYSEFQGMGMEDPRSQFENLVIKLAKLRLAYLHVVTARMNSAENSDNPASIDFVIKAWGDGSPILVAGGMNPRSAKLLVAEWTDKDIIVVFGRYFIANPDLPFRLKFDKELNLWNRDTFYTAQATGYTDYPFHPIFDAWNLSSVE